MQFFSDLICLCNAGTDIDFTAVMATKGVKVVLTICGLLYAADPLFRCLIHEVIIEDMMKLTCAILEVSAAYWCAGNSLSYEGVLEICSVVRSCLSPHGV